MSRDHALLGLPAVGWDISNRRNQGHALTKTMSALELLISCRQIQDHYSDTDWPNTSIESKIARGFENLVTEKQGTQCRRRCSMTSANCLSNHTFPPLPPG